MEEKTKEQLLDEKLQFTKKNVYEEATPGKLTSIFEYAEGYKCFLDAAKTEREAVAFAGGRKALPQQPRPQSFSHSYGHGAA